MAVAVLARYLYTGLYSVSLAGFACCIAFAGQIFGQVARREGPTGCLIWFAVHG